jgi:uncharacterized protein DUF4383
MQTRLFSLVIGIAYVLIGILGFIPALRTTPAANAPHVDITASYGYLLGQFPVNAVHNGVHIVIGILGILAFARFSFAIGYCRTLFLVYGLLAIIGFMPKADTLWGLAPIFGSDAWLHTATALLAAYFGWVAHEPTYVEPARGHAVHA